jgi:hypothetical protein
MRLNLTLCWHTTPVCYDTGILYHMPHITENYAMAFKGGEMWVSVQLRLAGLMLRVSTCQVTTHELNNALVAYGRMHQ